MSKRPKIIIIIGILLVTAMGLPVPAKDMIYNILDKGSEWTLNVDGEVGTLELLGGSGSNTGGSGWRMDMEVRWQGITGSLRAEADNENLQQRVFLYVKRQNGTEVSCEGYIARENDGFMAGISRYPAGNQIVNGAWYAQKKQTAPAPGGLPGKPLPRQDIGANDAEPPVVNIKVEGILVFTLYDTINLRASAVDNMEIAQVGIYIDGQERTVCRSTECRYSATLIKTGPHTCWATAVDSSGNKAQSDIVEFMVLPTPKPGPNLITKIQPSMPTTRDRITFIADASHSSGVENITIYVNGQLVQTCNQNHCEYNAGPFGGSEISWRVSAKSVEGIVTYGDEQIIPITQIQTGSCSISGRVYGPGARLANGFLIILYGPGDLTSYRGVESLYREGIYSFSELPAGKYKLTIETKSGSPFNAHPVSRVVECTTGIVEDVNFELK